MRCRHVFQRDNRRRPITLCHQGIGLFYQARCRSRHLGHQASRYPRHDCLLCVISVQAAVRFCGHTCGSSAWLGGWPSVSGAFSASAETLGRQARKYHHLGPLPQPAPVNQKRHKNQRRFAETAVFSSCTLIIETILSKPTTRIFMWQSASPQVIVCF